MRRKPIILTLFVVFLMGFLFLSYTAYQKRNGAGTAETIPTNAEGTAPSAPTPPISPPKENVRSTPPEKRITDAEMQKRVDTLRQSLQSAGKSGADERASVGESIAALQSVSKAQAKMLESVVVPLLTPPHGGTVVDKMAALDYLYMTNSAAGEPYLPKLLKDPDPDVRRRAELYQMRRARRK